MRNEKLSYPKFSYDKHAKTCAPNDFLGQIRRTVQGVPVSDEQINMIISAIKSGLTLNKNEALLELACGNGILSKNLFDSCQSYLGVDLSECLISVAKTNFERLPEYRFTLQDAAEYTRKESHPENFSKALCYAGFQFFSADDATEILRLIHNKFVNVSKFFIGNLPDRERAAQFYKEKQPSEQELVDCSTAIGTWRTQNEFTKLAYDAGWKVKFTYMPAEFHASYYRYDAILYR